MITYHKEEIEFELPDEERLSEWLIQLCGEEGKTLVQLSYIFCSDEYLLNINKEYLDHDYFTDIITFPYKQDKEIESDIFISIDRVKENAQNFGVTFEKELLRVMSHGLLHLMGYGDKTEKEKKKMRMKENEAVDKFLNQES